MGLPTLQITAIPAITDPGYAPAVLKVLEYRHAEAPLTAATNYYFDPVNGLDTNAGTIAQPYQTITKANTIINAWTTGSASNRLGIRLIRGGVWRSPAALLINQPYVTVSDYGAGNLPKPLLTMFATLTSYAGYILTSDTTTFAYPWAGGEVTFVKEAGHDTFPLMRQASVANVQSTPGSWINSGGYIYIHPWGANTQSYNYGGRTWEACVSNSQCGIDVVGPADYTRIHSIWVEGQSANKSSPALTSYPIRTQNYGTQSVLITDCEGYYSNLHTIGMNTGNAAGGGITTVVGCRLGLQQYSNTGNTLLVAYATNGGQEAVFAFNCFAYGIAPTSDGDFNGGGSGYLMHTGSPTTYIGLGIDFGNYNVAGQFQTWITGGMNCVAPWTDLAQCKGTSFGHRFYARQPLSTETAYTTIGYSVGWPTMAWMNLYQEVRTNQPGANPANINWSAGTIINARILIDLAGFNPYGTTFYMYFGGNATVWVGGEIVFASPYAGTYGLGNNTVLGNQAGSSNGQPQNDSAQIFSGSHIEFRGPTGATMQIGTTNDSTHLIRNCYDGVTAKTGANGYSGDAALVESMGHYNGQPFVGDALYGTGATLAAGYPLVLDAAGHVRASHNIGPHESDSRTLSTDAAVASVVGGATTVVARVSSPFQGLNSVTLSFRDAGGHPVPGATFTVVGLGTGAADPAGNRTLALPAGVYTVRTAPAAGLLWADAAITVGGDGAFILTASAVALAPPASPSQVTAYLTTRDGQGHAVGGVTLTFQLLDPSSATDSYDLTDFTAVSDATGQLQAPLLSGAHYQARSADGPWTAFTTGSPGSLFPLPEVLGSYT